MSDERIATDLGRKIRDRLQDIIQRELELADHVLPRPMIAEIMIELCAGMSNAAGLLVMQMARADSDLPALYDLTLTEVDRLARTKRDGSIKTLAALRGVAL